MNKITFLSILTGLLYNSVVTSLQTTALKVCRYIEMGRIIYNIYIELEKKKKKMWPQPI